jgi:hypothetical protein
VKSFLFGVFSIFVCGCVPPRSVEGEEYLIMTVGGCDTSGYCGVTLVPTKEKCMTKPLDSSFNTTEMVRYPVQGKTICIRNKEAK